MIYCVVPEALADELYDKLTAYYAEDPNVDVIVDRRKAERRSGGGTTDSGEARQQRDRRRQRVPGEFPKLDSGDS
jgi:hypothetical protein